METPVGGGGVGSSGVTDGGVVGRGRGLQGTRHKVWGPVLTILATEDSDSATYRCYANNTEGVAMLQVRPKTAIPSVFHSILWVRTALYVIKFFPIIMS